MSVSLLGRSLTLPPALGAWAGGAAAVGVPLLVYLRTLAPTVYGLDSAELTTGAYALGIVHAPGSPLYLLLGHLFARLPIGDVGYRLNLMSALASAGTAGWLYLILKQLTGRAGLALLTAWWVAFSYYFWVGAGAAEIYPVQACLAAALIWLALRWRAQKRAWQLAAIAFLFGLGLGNHLSLALWAPGLACLVLDRAALPWRRPALWVGALAGGLAGASVYLYLPLRALAHPLVDYARDYWQVNLASWNGFWWMVTARMFASLMWAVPLSALPGVAAQFVYQLWSNFLGLGVLVGLVGLWASFQRERPLGLALLLMCVGHLAFYLPYNVADKDVMNLPVYLVWGLWLGLGLHALQTGLQRRAPGACARAVPVTVGLLVLCSVVINYRLADLSHDRTARAVGQKIMASTAPGAWFFGTWADAPVLEYLQVVEGQRLDLVVRNLVFLSPQARQVQAYRQLLAGDRVYTSAPALFSNSEFWPEAQANCDCYELKLADRPNP